MSKGLEPKTISEVNEAIYEIGQEMYYSRPYPHEFSKTLADEEHTVIQRAEEFIGTFGEPIYDVRFNDEEREVEFLVDTEDDDGIPSEEWLSES